MFSTLFKGLSTVTARGSASIVRKPIQDTIRQVQTSAPAATTATTATTTAATTTDPLVQKLRDQLRYYAVAEIAGRPFLITKNDKVIVNRLKDVKVGDVLKLDKVRELGSKDYTLKGSPFVPENIHDIHATVIEHTKSKMIQIVKKKRRKNYKRTIEHKQTHTVLRISKVDVL